MLEAWTHSQGSGIRTYQCGSRSLEAAPKLGLSETMELLSRVLGAGDED